MRLSEFRRRGVQLATTVGALFLLACGGGGDLAGVGSGGTGSVATVVGPISGFGSVIVNGIEFDDTASTVDDGLGRALRRDALRLGMLVSVQGSVAAGTTRGKATAISVMAEVRGPVDAVNAAAGTLVVLGRSVTVRASTVLDGIANLGALAAGDFVEVHGLRDTAAGTLVATRIEKRVPGTTPLDSIEIRGEIAGFNAAARTFRVGSQAVSYAGATLQPANLALADGLAVEVHALQRNAAGTLLATLIEAEPGAKFSSDGAANVDGIVGSYVSPSSFKVDGVAVNAAGASYTGGSAATLANGWRVRVQGTWSGNGVKATQVGFIGGAPGSASQGEDDDDLELKGPITSFTSLRSFVVRNQTVDAAFAVFEGGTATQLRAGIQVEVKGSPNGSVLRAARVKFE